VAGRLPAGEVDLEATLEASAEQQGGRRFEIDTPADPAEALLGAQVGDKSYLCFVRPGAYCGHPFAMRAQQALG
jgi:hypothetical protein